MRLKLLQDQIARNFKDDVWNEKHDLTPRHVSKFAFNLYANCTLPYQGDVVFVSLNNTQLLLQSIKRGIGDIDSVKKCQEIKHT